ncbi:hypothetical protein QTO34_002879 [Cnephaeus nilssonii]|uniref:Ig-like domain-containing protein n=1 Tax=Cnephaeus nilssonii TaxID=3371016 RepID=A0AA40HT47_CNENI|nr:hypothetical protein QTO34_002879 [Eptesicus nilssonii]
MTGVHEMMGCIQRRVDHLTGQCSAHKEFALKKQQLAASVEGCLGRTHLIWEVWARVEMSIQEISLVLSNAMDVGSNLSESEKILRKYLELDIQAKEASHELEAATKLMTEKNEFEPDEVASLSSKAKWLEEELNILGQSIGSRSQVLQTYVAFLKSSGGGTIEEQCERLKEFYRRKARGRKRILRKPSTAEKQWQLFLKRSFLVQDLGLEFLTLINMAKENEILNVKNKVHIVENTMESQKAEREELGRLRMAWRLTAAASKPVKQQWGAFKEQLRKTTHNLKLLQEALVPVSALDLGGSLQTISGLRKNWKAMKPQFQQLNDEVQYIVKESEELNGKGAPVKEKYQQLKDLIQLHQKQRERIQDYEDILYKTVQFHQVKEELEHLKSRELEFLEQPKELDNVHDAQVRLRRSQEKQAHIDHLHKLALCLGVDIISSAQRPSCTNVSAKNLQRQLDILEGESVNWRARAEEHGRTLAGSLQYCTTRDEINELRESFKDIKKKFNNLKFNYTKKNEKAKNLKALKYQIQQVDMYAEKIQILKRKMEKVENKTPESFLNYPNSKITVLLEAMKDLQKHVDEFDKVVTDYKKNLDLTEHLHEMIEECHFWCEDASATVVRVGKYSTECQTGRLWKFSTSSSISLSRLQCLSKKKGFRRSVTSLSDYMDFKGFEEGQKCTEKIVAKHKEVLESITELCGSLTELEEKLKIVAQEKIKLCFSYNFLPTSTPPLEDLSLLLTSDTQPENRCFSEALLPVVYNVPPNYVGHLQQGGAVKMNLNSEDFHDNCIDLLKEPLRNKQTVFNEEMNKEQVQGAGILPVDGAGEAQLPRDLPRLSSGQESGVQGLALPADTLSAEEHAEPRLALAPSDMEVEEQASPSLGLHVSSDRMQMGARGPGEAQECGLPPPAAFADTCNDERETFSSHFEKPSPQFKAEPPFTSRGFLEQSTAISKTHADHPGSMPSGVHERACQQHPRARESVLETREEMHAANNGTKNQDRLHASQDALSGLGFQSGPSRAYQRQVASQEEIKSTSAKNSVVSLAGQAPHFSRRQSNVTVVEGSPVTLEVEVTGFPEPTLTWYKKGQTLPADGRLQVLHKETRHAVFIPKVCRADAGLYVARAQNASNRRPPITRINWIMLCVIYVSVSLVYWLLRQ